MEKRKFFLYLGGKILFLKKGGGAISIIRLYTPLLTLEYPSIVLSVYSNFIMYLAIYILVPSPETKVFLQHVSVTHFSGEASMPELRIPYKI